MKTHVTKNNEKEDVAWKKPDRKARGRLPQPCPETGDGRMEILRRSLGNHAVQDLFRSGALQPKLTVSEPGDRYELEADRVADQVMRMPVPVSRVDACSTTPRVHRRETDAGEEEIRADNLSGRTPEVTPGFESAVRNLQGGGNSLDGQVRETFEPRFNHDFGDVRIHTNANAADMADAVGARAFTLGRDVVFGRGQYEPGSTEGQRLLAHELTHVIQQRGSGERDHADRQTPSPSAPPPTPAQTALNAIAAFRRRTSPQAFPKLDRNTIADELQQRVANPSLINQAGLPLCGPAAFAYVWAVTNIATYVQCAISLFENGTGKLGSIDISPDSDLKSKSPGSYTWQAGLTPAQADWLVLSSIRDSENSAIDFEGGPSETVSGGTPEGDVIKWLRELGFKKVVDDVDRTFGDTVDDAKKVNANVGAGNYILLCVDAHMIDANMKKKGEGNHWVVLVGSMTFANGTVSFRAWTWGRFYDVSVTDEKFNSTYYGAIIALK